jgi:hypothetical protein
VINNTWIKLSAFFSSTRHGDIELQGIFAFPFYHVFGLWRLAICVQYSVFLGSSISSEYFRKDQISPIRLDPVKIKNYNPKPWIRSFLHDPLSRRTATN